MALTFLCDTMLGKLCKLLRMCGLDTQYIHKGRSITLLAKKESRIILTKNTRYQNKERTFFITSSEPLVQLKTVMEHFDLERDIALFSRCLECNGVLTAVDKKDIKERIPFYTYQHFNEFAECPDCHKIYWQGSHYTHMQKSINTLLEEIANESDNQ